MGIIEPSSLAAKETLGTIKQRVISNFGWSIVSEAAGRGVFFFSNIYLARKLGVSNFGLFILAQTLANYFWYGVDLGTNEYGIREIAKNKENAQDIISPLFTIRIIAGVVLFGLYTLSLLFINMPTINKLTFLGCGLFLVTYAFYSVWMLKGIEQFKYIAYGSIASSAFLLFGFIYFVKDQDSVVLASFIWSLSYVVGSIAMAYYLAKDLNIKHKTSFDFNLWMVHLRESFHFTISGGLVLIYSTLPIFFLSLFLSTYEVGIFSAPLKIIFALVSAGLLIPGAFYPVLSELYQSDSKRFLTISNRLLLISFALGLPVGVIGTVFADDIIRLLLGEQYTASVILFKIMVWLVPFHFVRNSYRTLLLAGGLQRSVNLGFFLGLVGVTITGLIFIPRNGVIGAVVSLIVAETLILFSMLFIYIYALKKRCGTSQVINYPKHG